MTKQATNLQAFAIARNHDDNTGLMMIKAVKGKREKVIEVGTFDRCSAIEMFSNTKADKFYITNK